MKGGGSGGGGAVLVFLPGAPEIGKAARALRDHAPLAAAAGGVHKLRILPLHGALSAKEQSAVFVKCVTQVEGHPCSSLYDMRPFNKPYKPGVLHSAIQQVYSNLTSPIPPF